MAGPRSTDSRASDRASHLRAVPSAEVDTTDWPAQAADTIERVVQTVRDKTTGPAINAARWLVAGTFLVITGTATLVLITIALVRFLNVYLPDAWVGDDHIWVAYGIVGLIFSMVGLFCLYRARRASSDAT